MEIISLLGTRNQQLERQAICSILLRRKIDPGLSEVHFEGEEQRLFAELSGQWERNATIEPALLKFSGTEDLVKECIKLQPATGQMVVEELHRCWMARELGMAIACSKGDSVDEIRSFYAKLSDLLISRTDDKYDHTSAVSDLLADIERGVLRQSKITGFPVGIEDFDTVTNGVEPGKFYVLGALKKTGKSRWMTFWAIQLWKAGAGVHINSLEMNRNQLNSCALAHFADINSRKLGNMMSREELMKINQHIGMLHDIKWSIYRDYSVPELKTRLIYERQNRKVDVVFIDFIQRMRDDKYGKDRVREVESIAKGLADMSRELNVAVIALAQLSGEAEKLKDNEIPTMSYLKESQGIAENADTIIVMHNEARNQSQFTSDGGYTLQPIRMRIEQRYGISGGIIGMLGDLRTCTFKSDPEYRATF
jgi:KaiC/GvpD/RAD55 family RecA-like ATPase